MRGKLGFIKNKLVIFVVLVLVSVVGYEVYASYSKSLLVRDTGTYLEVIEGKGKVVRPGANLGIVSKGDPKVLLSSGDKVVGLLPKSVLVVEWGDGSITRLGGRSEIEINENFVSEDYSSINIDFDLNKGKSWSNVVRSVGEDSYFNQNFETYVAGVRGTVYEINLDESYIFSADHAISVNDTESGKIHRVKEGQVFSTSFWEELDAKVKDIVWTSLNNGLDEKYIESLYAETTKYIESLNNSPKSLLSFVDTGMLAQGNISSLNLDLIDLNELGTENPEELYNSLYASYQNLSFVKPGDDLYEKKLDLSKMLVSLSGKQDEVVLRHAVYDLEDSGESGKDIGGELYKFVSTSSELGSFPDYLKSDLKDIYQNNDFVKGLREDIDGIIESVGNTNEGVKNVLEAGGDVKGVIDSAVKSAGETNVGDLDEKTKGAINSFLDDNFGSLIGEDE